ncbi:ubiquinone biosynthesis accessory factor UbiJ [Basilea psittacipulmonis]|uniref:SCP2 domain-containing protein n=1 Tax=Basilea psittacipulmonis DSM 24701 TaxID=1072685 RepID=A0A077DBV3_9BURK|nr:SCP2 sterol-binding domain-containing protein [Basilea psittacipulmonis]AIL32139.1 hypothetical protein IX83_01300 [Basilea psittacipulmonis DSM 24701]
MSVNKLSMLPSVNQVLVGILNKMLSKEAWAQKLVQEQAGKTICLNLATISLLLMIQADGSFSELKEPVQPNVTLTLKAEQLKQFITMSDRSPDKIASLLHLEGDAGLAQMLSTLAKDLRWDIRHDLSQKIGAIPAELMITGFMKSIDFAKDMTKRAAQTSAEYLAYEYQIMANQAGLKMLSQDILDLKKRIERLEVKG